jgi:TPP-dependent pyruvate/acetoin dehydrogenase alpha subunit
MNRYPAYDPPEYVGWTPDPEVMAEFAGRIAADPARRALIDALSPEAHLALYAGLLRNRLHDIALKRWVKLGVISKAWLGTGEEASTVGAVHALEAGDHVGPMIRNAGACHEMGMPVAEMLRAYLGTYDTITKGRDLHTGDRARGVIPPISMVAALVPVFAGIGLGFRIKGESKVAMTWVGDGATRTWEFHEGVGLAAVGRLPVIFVIQNNQVALGTTLAEGVAGDLHRLGELYGIPSLSSDGNNVLDVHAATRQARALCAKGEGPVFLVAETFRMGGHATHDESEARDLFPEALFERWGLRDPIGMYETWLVAAGPPLAGAETEPALHPDVRLAAGHRPGPDEGTPRAEGTSEENARTLAAIEERVIAEVDAAAEEALRSRETAKPPPGSTIMDVYAD